LIGTSNGVAANQQPALWRAEAPVRGTAQCSSAGVWLARMMTPKNANVAAKLKPSHTTIFAVYFLRCSLIEYNEIFTLKTGQSFDLFPSAKSVICFSASTSDKRKSYPILNYVYRLAPKAVVTKETHQHIAHCCAIFVSCRIFASTKISYLARIESKRVEFESSNLNCEM
jgi:hypothetical protein